MTPAEIEAALTVASRDIAQACARFWAVPGAPRQSLEITFSLAAGSRISIGFFKGDTNHQRLLCEAMHQTAKRRAKDLHKTLRAALPGIATRDYKVRLGFAGQADGRVGLAVSLGPEDYRLDHLDIFPSRIREISEMLAPVATPGRRTFKVNDIKVAASDPADALLIYLALCDVLRLKEDTLLEIDDIKVVETFSVGKLAQQIIEQREAVSAAGHESRSTE